MQEKKKLIILAIRFHRNYMEGKFMKTKSLLATILAAAIASNAFAGFSISAQADTVSEEGA